MSHYLSMAILVNNIPIDSFKFSGGEVSVKIKTTDISNQTKILAYLNSSDDVLSLLMTADAVRRINPLTAISLTIPYFPYARQDRVCNEGEALSVRVMAELVNSLQCESVTVYDPHSDVTPALLNRCKIESLTGLVIKSSLAHHILEKNLVLISPDAGAEKKIKQLAHALNTNQNTVQMLCARKTRDTSSGAIISTEISGDIRGRDLIILDDICDGGRTFVELAKELKARGARDLYLYVTHGIFSKGFDELKHYFKQVYQYYSFTGITSNFDQFLITLKGDLR